MCKCDISQDLSQERVPPHGGRNNGTALSVCRSSTCNKMFDVSLGEVLVVVSGAGMLLGRKEITLMARSVGRGLGRIVGTLQGLRIKYEEKSQGSQLYQLHKNVKDGLNDMSTIGADISSLSSSPHSRYASMAAGAPVSEASPAAATWKQSRSATSSSTSQENALRKSGGILGRNNRRAAAAATDAPVAASKVLPALHNLSAVDFRLAQLILADEELNRQRGPASMLESNGQDSAGVDLVERAICESILNATREAHDAGQRP